MYSCKELLGLSLLSLYEGELLGVVDKLYFDKDLRRLSCLGLVGEDGMRWTVPSKSIYHIGPNAITIKNKQNLGLDSSADTLLANPISSKAYSIEGEYLGLVNDITFDNKFRSQKIYLDNGGSEEVSNLTSCGKSTLIFSKTRIKRQTLSPNRDSNIATEEKIKQQNNVKVELSLLPIGKICTRDILNFNNEILIKAGTVITKKHISELKKYNKLNELKLFSN